MIKPSDFLAPTEFFSALDILERAVIEAYIDVSLMRAKRWPHPINWGDKPWTKANVRAVLDLYREQGWNVEIQSSAIFVFHDPEALCSKS